MQSIVYSGFELATWQSQLRAFARKDTTFDSVLCGSKTRSKVVYFSFRKLPFLSFELILTDTFLCRLDDKFCTVTVTKDVISALSTAEHVTDRSIVFADKVELLDLAKKNRMITTIRPVKNSQVNVLRIKD